MRKIFLIAISILLLACSTLSIKIPQITLPTPISPNETELAQIVLSTVRAIQLQTPTPVKAPDPASPCVQSPPCPTCIAAEEKSPILPAPPTIAVPAQSDVNTVVPKLPEATSIPTVNSTTKIFQIQPGTPVFLPNFAHQDQACNWLGIAGQVFDLSGAPAKNIVLVVDGKLSDKTISMVGMTGTTSQYGPGGYEIVLSSIPMSTNGTLTITVYNLNGIAISDPFSFNTLDNCQKNLTLINFQQMN